MTELQIIENRIFLFRGQRVMLDSHLAELYGAETRVLNRAAKRNSERFSEDFMFQLAEDEVKILRSQFVILEKDSDLPSHYRYRPYVFTELGVAMLSSVPKSSQAIAINISIMRAFVALRQHSAMYAELKAQMSQLEQKYDHQFTKIFNALDYLMSPPAQRTRIGFDQNPLDA